MLPFAPSFSRSSHSKTVYTDKNSDASSISVRAKFNASFYTIVWQLVFLPSFVNKLQQTPISMCIGKLAILKRKGQIQNLSLKNKACKKRRSLNQQTCDIFVLKRSRRSQCAAKSLVLGDLASLSGEGSGKVQAIGRRRF